MIPTYMSEVGRYVLGIIFTLAGAAIANFGMILQKRQVKIREGKFESHNRQRKKEVNQENAASFRNPTYVISILMQTILCFPPFLLGMDYLGITLSLPLANAGVIFLVIGAKVILHDAFSTKEQISICFLIISMVSLGFGAVSGNIEFNTFMLGSGLKELGVFTLCTIGLEIFLVFIIKINKLRLIGLGLMSGVLYAQAGLGMQLLTISMSQYESALGLTFSIVGLFTVILTTVLAIIVTQIAFKAGDAVPFFSSSQITMNAIPVFAGVTVFNQSIQFPIWFYIGIIGIIVSSSILNENQIKG